MHTCAHRVHGGPPAEVGAQHPEQFKLFYMFAYDYNRKEGQKVVGRSGSRVSAPAGPKQTALAQTVCAGPLCPKGPSLGTVSGARARMLGFAAATRRGLAPHRHRDWPHIGTGTGPTAAPGPGHIGTPHRRHRDHLAALR
jgi:hypothetical protein